MNGPAVSQADDPQEQWHRVHAQLLKSVADAQAKLLAAQNETNDKLTDVVIPMLASLENRLMEAHNNHCSLTGLVESLLAKPRRQVEKLHPKRIVKRAAERKRPYG